MVTWETTFWVEPWPDIPWDRRDLANWQSAGAHHTFTDMADRRSVSVTVQLAAEDEPTAVAAGRAEVELGFPPSRYRVQSPRIAPSTAAQQLLRAGAALYLRQTAGAVYRDQAAPR
jgi:hypothetical protein